MISSGRNNDCYFGDTNNTYDTEDEIEIGSEDFWNAGLEGLKSSSSSPPANIRIRPSLISSDDTCSIKSFATNGNGVEDDHQEEPDQKTMRESLLWFPLSDPPRTTSRLLSGGPIALERFRVKAASASSGGRAMVGSMMQQQHQQQQHSSSSSESSVNQQSNHHNNNEPSSKVSEKQSSSSSDSKTPALPSVPLPSDFTPGPWTVQLGRGRCTESPGNRRLRALAKMHLEEYSQANGKVEKSIIVNKVMSVIRDKCREGGYYGGGGGFVKLEKGQWYVASERSAREKVGAAFRECCKKKRRVSLDT